MNENTTLQEQLLLYVFDELPPDRVGAFEHHLISDAALQEEHGVVSGLLNLLQADLQPSPLPAISPDVLARLEERFEKSS